MIRLSRKMAAACPERPRRVQSKVLWERSSRHDVDDDGESTGRLEAAARGDRAAWGAVLAQHRERLRRMVALRHGPPAPGAG